MMDIYEAAVEGRYQIDLDVKETADGKFSASFDQFGIAVSAVEDSPMHAVNVATEKVLEALRTHDYRW